MFSASPSNDNRLKSDFSLPFMIENSGIRGRFVRLNESVNTILSTHKYPLLVSRALSDTLVLASLLGSTLKIDGILSIQIQGDGPIRYLVVDYSHGGFLRGYAAMREPDVLKEWSATPEMPRSATELFGKAHMAITIDSPLSEERYQGIVALEHHTLSECMMHYFAQSEQLETHIVSTTLAPLSKKKSEKWLAGGVMIQRLPEETPLQESLFIHPSRGKRDLAAEWQHAVVLINTLKPEEFTDNKIDPNTILHSLFHADGARVFTANALRAQCRCTREKISYVLTHLPPAERSKLFNKKGTLNAECQFCKKEETFTREDFPE